MTFERIAASHAVLVTALSAMCSGANRDDRKVRTLFDLRRTVSMCNMQLQLGLFPEDERDVAAYLNHHFYKLRQ